MVSLSWETTGEVMRIVWPSEITAEGVVVDGVAPPFVPVPLVASGGASTRVLNVPGSRRTTTVRTARGTMIPRRRLPSPGRFPITTNPQPRPGQAEQGVLVAHPTYTCRITRTGRRPKIDVDSPVGAVSQGADSEIREQILNTGRFHGPPTSSGRSKASREESG